MAKQPDCPDDNDLAQAGSLGGYLDGLEPVEPGNDTDDGPARSTRRPAGPVPPLVSAVEASETMAHALRSPAPLVVLRSTPGAGKSREVRAVVAEHTAANGRSLIFVPTHALAGQTVSELALIGVRAVAPMGVPRVRRLPVLNQGEASEQSACVHAAAADLLIRSKARIRQDMCPHCPEQDNYQGGGGECPAYAAGGGKAPVMVFQHTLLAAMLREHTARLLGPTPEKPDDAGAALAIVDESLALCTFTALDGARTAYKRLRAGEMSETVRRDLEPLLLAVLEGAERAAKLGREGASLREIVQLAGVEPGDEDGAQRLAWAQRADGAGIWAPGLQEALAQRAVKSPGDPDVREHLERLARLTALCEAIVDASFHPDAPALHVTRAGAWQLVTRARWARYALGYIAAGGRLRWLDATAPIGGLRALWGDALEVVQVDVQDAARVVRRYLQWQRGARGRHVTDGQADPDRLRGPLRVIAQTAVDLDARQTVVLTDKPTAEALRAWLDGRAAGEPTPAMVPAELVAFVDAGGVLLVGHYGAQRGLDTWAGCELLVTLGDPWPDLGAARAEALALGLDPDAWALEGVRAELLQAWGRGRTVHRTTPVTVLHLGSRRLAPTADWAPQWGEVQAEVPRRGAPTSVRPPSDPASWKADREARGMKARQHAAFLGIAWGTYCRLGTAALQRRSVEVSVDTPSETAEKGSPDVAHKWVLDENEYGGSGGPGAPSLIAICGPPETPVNPPIVGVTIDPEVVPPAPLPSTDWKRVRIAPVPAPVESAPLAPDAPRSTVGPASPRTKATKVKGDAA